MKEVFAMTRKIGVLISFIVVLLALGCAPQTKREATKHASHPHYYPYTEVMGDYHLRLVVSHADGKMALVFEDIAEKPIKLVRLERIKGEVTLPDGTAREEIFRPVDASGHGSHWSHRRPHPGVSKKRIAGIFTTSAEWIKETSKFSLDVTVPFKGSDHQLTFQYEAPGGEIPSHRR